MNKTITVLAVFISFMSYSQNVGINSSGSAPHASAGLDVNFSNKGVLIPRVALTGTGDVTTVPSPETSLLLYNTGTGGLTPAGYYYWNGSAWIQFGALPASQNWSLTGNALTSSGSNFLGTTDAQDLVIRTSNTERIRVSAGGNVGIGTGSVASYRLNVQGNVNFSRDGAGECCSGADNYTLSIAEATGATDRVSTISFHNSGESEGFIKLLGGGTNPARSGQRRFSFGDNQGQSTTLQVQGLAGTGTRYVVADANGILSSVSAPTALPASVYSESLAATSQASGSAFVVKHTASIPAGTWVVTVSGEVSGGAGSYGRVEVRAGATVLIPGDYIFTGATNLYTPYSVTAKMTFATATDVTTAIARYSTTTTFIRNMRVTAIQVAP